MRITLINKSDSTGGAAVVSLRLVNALRDAGIDARMLVTEKKTDSPHVALAAQPLMIRRAFLAERLAIFARLGFKQENLFKVDTCGDGVVLWRHPWVRDADIICLNWVNQGVMSLRGIRRLAEMGKKIVWTMHDMWCMTGVCHHAGTCDGFRNRCGNCPLIGSRKSPRDLSFRTWQRKDDLRRNADIHYVAVSNWLAERAAASSLLADADMTVIPNAFPLDDKYTPRADNTGKTVRLLMGAARLDDPIKGLPILIEATRLLAAQSSGQRRYLLITYGGLKDPAALDNIAIPHTHLGTIPPSRIREAYDNADIVVSTSLYETLPGTLVEGQAYGCVPVAFDRGGQADIIDHGKTGCIVPFADDMHAAAAGIADGITSAANGLLAEETRRRMFEAIRSKFAAPAVAARYIDLFRRILRQ